MNSVSNHPGYHAPEYRLGFQSGSDWRPLADSLKTSFNYYRSKSKMRKPFQFSFKPIPTLADGAKEIR
jgi:hypothetical protein